MKPWINIRVIDAILFLHPGRRVSLPDIDTAQVKENSSAVNKAVQTFSQRAQKTNGSTPTTEPVFMKQKSIDLKLEYAHAHTASTP